MKSGVTRARESSRKCRTKANGSARKKISCTKSETRKENDDAILFRMSRAFVKEDVDLPERSGRKRSASGLPPGATNYITARGPKRLSDELQKLRAGNAVSERVTDLEQILASVHVVDPPDAPSDSVTFGAT